jgi:hypothetical protein
MMCGSPRLPRKYEYATAPLPPGLFTTLIGTVTIFSLVMILATVRAKMSLPPPAADWTMNSDSGSLGIAVPL